MTEHVGGAFERMLADLARETAEREAWEASPEGRAELERERREQAAKDARIAAREARVAREAAVRVIVASGINLRESDAEAIVDGHVKRTPTVELVEAWLAHPPSKHAPMPGVPKSRAWDTVIIHGERGTGKTWAAGVALHRAAGCGQYAKVRRLCAIYRAGWGDDAEAWDSAMRCSLLVVDELGTSRDRDLERDMLQELVDERHSRGRASLLISNLGWKSTQGRIGLDSVFDARTIDRLADGRTKRLVTTGESMRRGGL